MRPTALLASCVLDVEHCLKVVWSWLMLMRLLVILSVPIASGERVCASLKLEKGDSTHMRRTHANKAHEQRVCGRRETSAGIERPRPVAR